MGSFEVVKLSEEPIVIGRFGSDYDMIADFPESHVLVKEVFEQQTEPFFYILNIAAMKFDFSQLVMRMADLTNSENGPYRHPLLQEIILVTTSDLGLLAVDAVHQEQYGALRARLCNSEEEAIEYTRSQVGV